MRSNDRSLDLGKLVVVERIDGSGKSTQIRLLSRNSYETNPTGEHDCVKKESSPTLGETYEMWCMKLC